MSDNENQNVEEVVQPETEAVQASPESPKEPQKGSAEYNFREARKAIEERNRRIQELEYQLQNQQQSQVSHDESDELEDVGADDYLTRRQAEQLALRKAQELIAAQEKNTLEDRTRGKFKDYDDVVTDENVRELIEDDRDLADSISNSPNPYATAYKMIKKSSFYQDKGKKPSREEEKIVKNSQKPVSANAIQSRPLAQANNYAFGSEDERRALYREMTEFASRR